MLWNNQDTASPKTNGTNEHLCYGFGMVLDDIGASLPCEEIIWKANRDEIPDLKELG
jgi:hypothetical protein